MLIVRIPSKSKPNRSNKKATEWNRWEKGKRPEIESAEYNSDDLMIQFYFLSQLTFPSCGRSLMSVFVLSIISKICCKSQYQNHYWTTGYFLHRPLTNSLLRIIQLNANQCYINVLFLKFAICRLTKSSAPNDWRKYIAKRNDCLAK